MDRLLDLGAGVWIDLHADRDLDDPRLYPLSHPALLARYGRQMRTDDANRSSWHRPPGD